MPIVDLNGKRISYWTGRKSLLDGGEFVLFIHGAGGGQYTWSHQKAFFEKSFNPVVIELPGHGESGGGGEEEIGRYAEHVHSFMKNLGLSKVFLVGHSMGGAITQTVALKDPEGIQGIILVGTGARLRVLPLILDGIKRDFETTIREIVKFSYSRKAPGELIERGTSDLMRCRPEVLLGDFLACDRFDLMKEVEKIKVPTLVLCGDEDELTPIKYSRFLSQRIEGSRLEILPNAGHMVMMEAAEAFNRIIGEFVLNPTFSGNS
jgi:pimeloyl-ACP methyl ester carboxylesterase